MNYGFTKKQEQAFKSMQSGKNVFITGSGGTGKSYVIQKFIEWFKANKEKNNKKIYITSTTGLSSILVNGMTIHRFSGIGTGDRDIDYYYDRIKKPFYRSCKGRWIETAVLIIDEISMMDADLFDKLEMLAKKIRKKDHLPFGGIQIILSGDFLQLPPVNSETFCFESFTWDLVIKETIYLTENIRQKDTTLQRVLNNIRIANITDEVKTYISSFLEKEGDNKKENLDGYTQIFSRKDMVKQYNENQLKKLLFANDCKTENYTYKSFSSFPKETTPAMQQFYNEQLDNIYSIEPSIILCKGAQVMLTINKPDEGLANGSRGIVTGFTDHILKGHDNPFPIVKFQNGVVITIEAYSYIYDEKPSSDSKKKEEHVLRIQLPLIHAWAITIHKAQGMTLDHVRTDIGKSIFENGQVYVVLSRVRSPDGLSIINVDYSKIKAHQRVLEYYKSLESTSDEL